MIEINRYLATLMYVKKYKSAHILDVGCGSGIMSIMFEELGLNPIAIDKVKPLGFELPFVLCDVSSQGLPFADKSFDIVYMGAFIEHLPNGHKKVLQEAYRVLKPNGIIILDTPNIACLINRIRLLLGRSPTTAIEWFFNSPDYIGHYREFTRKEVKIMLEHTGFRVVKSKMIDLSSIQNPVPQVRLCIWVVGQKQGDNKHEHS